MDWANERYVRVYQRETVDDQLLSWQARALWHLMLPKFDPAGVIDLSRHGARGLAALLRMPLDLVEMALEELLRDGRVRLVAHGERGQWLFAPNYRQAQESQRSEAQRMRDYRARKAAEERLERLPIAEQLLLPAFGMSDSNSVTKPNGAETVAHTTVTTPRTLVTLTCSADSPDLPDSPDLQDPEPPNPPQAGAVPILAEGTGVGRQNGKRGKPARHRAASTLRPVPNATERAIAERVLAKLSERTERSYTAQAHVDAAVSLLRAGYSEDDLRTVVWDRCNRWFDDPLAAPRMAEFCRPSTLFGPKKFPDYLAEGAAAWAEAERERERKGKNGVHP